MPGFLSTSVTVGIVAVVAMLAGCGSSSHKSSDPSTQFSIANVSNLGDVLVDGNGRTVYILTSGGHTNVPCNDASGCTKYWPDLPLPSGVTAAKAGSGLNSSLLGTKKLSDGETYPTYNGWLIYEYSGDSSSGQANGQGITSFGGTWYALNAAGNPVTSAMGGPATTTNSGGGGY